MKRLLTFDEIKELEGQEVALTQWFEIDQDRINKFAESTLDKQWIHIDEEKAKKGPFKKTIAHGYLLISLLPHLSGDSFITPKGSRMAINYGMDKLRFIHPVTVGSKIRDRIVLTSVTKKADGSVLLVYSHRLEIKEKEKPALIVDTLVVFN